MPHDLPAAAPHPVARTPTTNSSSPEGQTVTSARDTPTTAATTPASHTALPTGWHELVEYEVACAYAAGWQAALETVAAGHAELDVTWQHIGRRGYEQRVRERLEQMEAHAAARHARDGTREWVGLEGGGVLPSADWGDDTKTSARGVSGPHYRRAA